MRLHVRIGSCDQFPKNPVALSRRPSRVLDRALHDNAPFKPWSAARLPTSSEVPILHCNHCDVTPPPFQRTRPRSIVIVDARVDLYCCDDTKTRDYPVQVLDNEHAEARTAVMPRHILIRKKKMNKENNGAFIGTQHARTAIPNQGTNLQFLKFIHAFPRNSHNVSRRPLKVRG